MQNICETTNFFTDYFLSRTEVIYYTLLFRADGRGSKVLTDKFGDSLERMTAVTDRHSAYFYFARKGQSYFAQRGQSRVPEGVNHARLFHTSFSNSFTKLNKKFLIKSIS